MIAVDGKTARGSRTPTRAGVHLFAALDHDSGVVLGQSVVEDKSNEITAFEPLLERIEVSGALVTADALHCQRAHADYLVGRGGHYLLVAKANQPTLHAMLIGLSWTRVRVSHESFERGHGREEHRRLQVLAVGGRVGIPFPHARVAVRVVRRRRLLGTDRWEREVVYAVTDLDWRQAKPELIAAALRGHWRIENQLHWVRDVTLGEDQSRIHVGHGPVNMAALRNFTVSRHRLAGAQNIATARRSTGRHPNRALDLLT